jgi:hypothetical protein
MPKLSSRSTSPTKELPTQRTSKPPEAPSEGTKANLSKCLGTNFLMKEASKCLFLVSCRHTIEALLSSILLRRCGHLSALLIPRTFQHKICHKRFMPAKDWIKVDDILEFNTDDILEFNIDDMIESYK